MRSDAHIILFDGVCNLCNGLVQFILRYDKKEIFRLGSLQSNSAREILTKYGLDETQMSSVVLVSDGKVFLRSNAVLKIFGMLGYPWRVAKLFSIIPAQLRDSVYHLIARKRYSWFGKRDQCMVPLPKYSNRFID